MINNTRYAASLDVNLHLHAPSLFISPHILCPQLSASVTALFRALMCLHQIRHPADNDGLLLSRQFVFLVRFKVLWVQKLCSSVWKQFKSIWRIRCDNLTAV